MPEPRRFRNLDLNLPVALDALLLDRNITRAGKRVHLSQSAMSGALARLREYFGDEILAQIGRRMIPPPLAESLAGPVRKLLLEIRATVASQPAFDPAAAQRTFRLMMSDYVATVLMSVALPIIERLAPHVSIEILSNDVVSRSSAKPPHWRREPGSASDATGPSGGSQRRTPSPARPCPKSPPC